MNPNPNPIKIRVTENRNQQNVRPFAPKIGGYTCGGPHFAVNCSRNANPQKQ